jgi:hypothetical protein
MDEPPAQQPVMLGRPLTDGQGFVDLYQRESELVLLFCARRVLDPETALDLTAETSARSSGPCCASASRPLSSTPARRRPKR